MTKYFWVEYITGHLALEESLWRQLSPHCQQTLFEKFTVEIGGKVLNPPETNSYKYGCKVYPLNTVEVSSDEPD